MMYGVAFAYKQSCRHICTQQHHKYLSDLFSTAPCCMPHISPLDSLKFHLIYACLFLLLFPRMTPCIRIIFIIFTSSFNIHLWCYLSSLHASPWRQRRSHRTQPTMNKRCCHAPPPIFTAPVCPGAQLGSIYDVCPHKPQEQRHGWWRQRVCVCRWGVPPSGEAVITHYIRAKITFSTGHSTLHCVQPHAFTYTTFALLSLLVLVFNLAIDILYGFQVLCDIHINIYRYILFGPGNKTVVVKKKTCRFKRCIE